MTRALLQQALEALEQRCGTQAEERQPGGLIDRLRDAVDAPDVTPAWHDAPTCPGMWVAESASRIFQLDEFNLPAYQNTAVRWFGPIPKDEK